MFGLNDKSGIIALKMFYNKVKYGTITVKRIYYSTVCYFRTTVTKKWFVPIMQKLITCCHLLRVYCFSRLLVRKLYSKLYRTIILFIVKDLKFRLSR